MANAQTIILNLKTVSDFSDVTKDINQVQQMLDKIKMPDTLKNSFNNIFTSLTAETQKYQNFLNSGFKTKGDVTGLESSGQKINALLQKLQVEMGKIKTEDLRQSFQIDPSKMQELSKRAAELQKNLQNIMSSGDMQKFTTQANNAAREIEKISKTKFTSNFTEAFNKGDINGATEALKRLVENHKAFQDGGKEKAFQDSIVQMREALSQLSSNADLQKITQQIRETDLAIDNLDTNEFQNLVNTFSQGRGQVENFSQGVRKLVTEQQQAASAARQHAQQLDQFKSQVMYFFSLTNSVQLFRRAIQKALNTVKELDATMTEAAVVTDFSVGDMWNKLPIYSKHARELGISINSMYQATTLYYQQGLKTNEAMELGIETMKMAKIAGMESAEATEAMTAALRGFNMELTETSAVQVNDVYSKLAAITASNTGQIATAMTKTASIAHNANMEFETTAALLAQIIETTQEAPETAGTAMKTIIARFSEVKALREKGQTTGKDSEGEGVDVNKISAALKTTGISMEGFFAGTEGLDSILLKLAEKWEGLDFETQRYIATMAAGSRQQSRFIAMMSDYSRTTELVTAANESAGASQAQFNKTLDSMETKLQNMSNAWEEFLMGLANNEILKAGIDVITGLVQVINNLTGSLPGPIKSIANLTLAILGLKVAAGVISAALVSITSKFTNGGVAAVKFGTALKTEFSGVRKLFSKQFWTIPKIDTTQQKVALKSLTQAQNQVVTSKNMEINAKKRSSAVDKGSIAYTNAATKGEQKRAIALAEVSAAYGLNSSQQAMLTSLTYAGVSADLALQAAQKGLTAETYNQMVAQIAASGATGEEARKKLEGAVATYTAMHAQELENKVTKLTVGQKFALIAATLFGNQAKRAEARESLKTAIANGTLSGANFILAISELTAAWPAWLLVAAFVALLAIVVVLIVSIVALVRWFKACADAASEQKQLEKLNERLKELSSSAEEAKERLESLSEARAELEQMQKTFQGLVKGSDEWNKALIDNNQKVLALLESYPMLSEYLTTGTNGELVIKDEGWNKATETLQNGYTAMLSAQQAVTIQRDSVAREIEMEDKMAEHWAKNNTSSDIYGGLMAGFQSSIMAPHPALIAQGAYQGATSDEYQAELMKKRMDMVEFNNTGAGKFLNILGGTAAGAGAGAAIGSLGGPIGTAIGAAIGGTVGLIGSTIAALNPKTEEDIEREQTGGLTYKEFDQFAAMVTERGIQDNKEAQAELLRELGYSEDVINSFLENIENMGASFEELANSAYAASIAEEAKINSIVRTAAASEEGVAGSAYADAAMDLVTQANMDYEDKVDDAADKYEYKDKKRDQDENEETKQAYADLMGMTLDEVNAKLEDDSLSYDTMAQALAADEVNKELVKQSQNTVALLDKISDQGRDKEKRNLLSGLMTDKGLGLGMTQLEQMKDVKTKDDMEKWLKKQGYALTDEEAKSMGFESAEAFIQTMYSNLQNAVTAEENAFNDANTLGIGDALKEKLQQLSKELINLGSETGLTAGQVKSLAGTLSKVAAIGGDVDGLLSMFPELMKGLDTTEAAMAQEILANTDWTDQLSIDSTVEALRELGVSIDHNMVQSIYNVTKAVKSLDLTTLENKLKSLEELAKSVQDKVSDGSKIFTKEERNALVNAGFGEGLFVQVGVDEFVFMGETNQLLSDIEGYVIDILGEMRGDLTAAVDQGRKFEAMAADKETYGDHNRTGMDIVQRLATGEIGYEGSGKAETIEQEHLINIAKKLGLNVDGYTPAMIQEAIVSAYNQTYGHGGKVLEQNENTLYQAGIGLQTTEAYKAAGTEDFMKLMSVAAQNEEKTKGKTLTYYKENGQDKFVKDYNPTLKKFEGIDPTTIAQYSYEQILSSVNNNEPIIDENGRRAMAVDLGLIAEGQAETENIRDIDEALRNFYQSTYLVEQGIDAYIAAEAGLGVALENTTKQIEDQKSEVSKDALAMKNLTAAAHKANKQMDTLNSTIEDQAQNLAMGDKNNQLYRAALEKTATAAQGVFGSGITTKFVEENKGLFLQLAEGGEVAEEAYKQLAQKYGQMIMLQKTGFAEGSEAAKSAAQIMNDAFNSVKPGASIDLTEYYAKLMAIEGMTEEAAKATIDAWGFSISTSEKTVWIKGGIISETKPNEEGWQEIKMIVGTRDTAAGTGVNAPKKTNTNKYENPYDKLHNKLEEINDTLRERERLERRYQRLISQNHASAAKLADLSKQIVASYQLEIAKQEEIRTGRIEQIEEEMSKNKNLQKYVQVETDQYGDKTLRIDWEALNKLKNANTGEKVDAYYDNIDSWLDSIYETETAIADAQDAIFEEMTKGMDEYLDLEDQVKEAIINARQKEIDELSNINDSINDANSKLLESMQEQIDAYRQARDNEKTEQELSDKQRRLAYLSQDTSGANAMEILQLQKEIEEGQESYTDQLIDQKISELQKQNDQAAEQRQQQIDLLQAQLDQDQKSGALWSQVEKLIENGIGPGGKLQGELEALLKESQDYSSLSQVGQMSWLNNIENILSQALAWQGDGSKVLSSLFSGEQINFDTADGQTLTGEVQADGTVKVGDDIYENVVWKGGNKFATSENMIVEPEIEEPEGTRITKDALARGIANSIWFAGGGWGNGATRKQHISEIGASYSAVQSYLNQIANGKRVTYDGKLADYAYNALKAKNVVAYKTGGLADFTGPAWLDGTKSKPEYILNADQTKAFFTLVDVLSGLGLGNSNSTEKTGDISYDIDINVESIGSDYDVEQVANKVKSLIKDDAMYRNNNTISITR